MADYTNPTDHSSPFDYDWNHNPQNQTPGAPARRVNNSSDPQTSTTLGPAAPPWQYQDPNAAAQPQTSPFDRTAFRDSWMGTGADKGAQDALLQQYGLTLDPAGRATLPTGEIIDLRIGAKAGGTQASWTNAGGTQNGVPVTGMGWEAGGNAATGMSSSSSSGGAPQGVSSELWNMLMSRAKQGTAIDRNDPNIRQQVDPMTAQLERQRRDYIADMAEREGPNANLRGENRLAMERAGQAKGLFEGQLIGRELASRRDEIQHALDSMRGMLSHEQELALRKELGYLNDATQKYGIDTNRGIAEGQLDLSNKRLGLDWNYYDWATDPSNPANLPN